MSDTQQKYINTYLDKTVGMLHEYVAMVIQLRTQLHMANDLIQEKDQVISTLTTESEKHKSDVNELNNAKNTAKSWEEQYIAMKNKISHMDTLTNQINEMKQALISKNVEVDELKNKVNNLDEMNNQLNDKIKEVDGLKKQLEDKQKQIDGLLSPAPKKSINTKNTKPITMKKVEETPQETDDF